MPGDLIKVYWTGLTGYNFVYAPGVFHVPDGIAAPPSPCVQHLEPKVEIGGIAAEVRSCTAAPGLAGVGELAVRVPEGLRSGKHDVKVIIGTKGNVVKLPVRVR